MDKPITPSSARQSRRPATAKNVKKGVREKLTKQGDFDPFEFTKLLGVPAGDFDPFELTKLLATDCDRTNTGGR